jgi:hypothetical protein
MKKLNTLFFICTALILFACSKDASKLSQPTTDAGYATTTTTSTVTSSPYVITLESVVSNGDHSWTWTWSVRNPNPGNGLGGTVQDLSHWGFMLGTCVNISNVVSAAYSFDGTNWTGFSPANEVDPSQDCMTDAVLKFEAGTTGTQKTYYKVTVNQEFGIDPNSVGFYKSGKRTDCGVFLFQGMGCIDQGGDR